MSRAQTINFLAALLALPRRRRDLVTATDAEQSRFGAAVGGPGDTQAPAVPRGPGDAPAAAELGLPVTTLMVHNIPPETSLLDLFEEWGSDGSYDLLYLPLRARGPKCAGFAFINFRSQEGAVAFKSRWHGARLPSNRSATRKMRVSNAVVQGLEANLDHFRAKTGSRHHCSAWVWKEGRFVTLAEV